MSEVPIVELRGVSKSYRQGKLEVQAVRDLSLSVHAGELVALCGPSGSGKTTVLNLAGALDVPTSGSVIIVFQAYNLVPVLTAYENAEIVLALQGVPAAERREKVMRVLEEVGLGGLADRRPDELSGGQQQRVAIARAIAAEPAVVLADEPTANVDSHTAERLLDLLEKLNRERGATFIFSTHDPRVMERARRIVTLVDGRLQSDEARARSA
jgi:putative ABC transport system ATP-binding protein